MDQRSRISLVLIFVFSTILCGALTSFAQDDLSDEKAREANTQRVLDQIHDLEVKLQETGKKLDVLESEVNHTTPVAAAVSTQETVEQTSGQQVKAAAPLAPVQATSAPAVQSAAVAITPVQEAPTPRLEEHWFESSNYWLPSEDFNKINEFQLSSEFSYLTYKEPGLMREKGPYFGVYGAYEYRPDQLMMWPVNVFHLDSHFNYGLVSYKNIYNDKVNDINDYVIEPRLWFGKDLNVTSTVELTPYAGVGYRFLYDTLSKADDGGYDRRSQYLYLPVGVESKFELPDDWQLGLNGEYDIFIQGWQTSYLSDIDTVLPNAHNTQKSGFGIRGSIDIVKRMEGINLLITPYIRYWHIKQSKIESNSNQYYIVTGYEPKNNSTEIGVRLGVEF